MDSMGSLGRDSVGSGPIHLGLHKDSISVGILYPGGEAPLVEQILADEESVRRLVGRFPDPGRLRACYEAGPTGYELHRLLAGLGVDTVVVAPSLIPRAPGDRVKTDRRDAVNLARLHRAGQLVAIAAPSPAEEAVRDLCRARGDLVADLTRARHRLGAFLLRHGRVWRGGDAWTLKHQAWLAGQRFAERGAQLTLEHYRAVHETRMAQLRGIEVEMAAFYEADPFAEQVRRLAAYRGVTRLGGLILAAEVFDWRRFPAAGQFMGFTGLTPSEHSSGGRTRRGRITKAGNEHLRTQLVESAWAYQHRASIGATLRRRQDRLDPAVLARSWKAQQRMCARFRHLAATHPGHPKTAAVGVARELAGFLWAEMTTPATPAAAPAG
jgi:transposase